MAHSDEAGSAVASLADDLARQWIVNNIIPDDAIEASTPAFRALMAAGLELSFDDFQHRDYVRPDWGFRQFAPPAFDAPFELYMPTAWRIESTEEALVGIAVDELGDRQQVMQVATRSKNADALGRALGGELLGFEISREVGPFINWRVVSAVPSGYRVWSIFSAGEHSLVCLGEAADVAGLKTQLTSSVNSIPWYHWIEAAKKQ